jgi:hypothetical protein
MKPLTGLKLLALLLILAHGLTHGPASAAEQVLVVDGAAAGAADGNAGNDDAPLATLGEAARRIQARIAEGERAEEFLIRVRPGVYRESVRLDFGPTSSKEGAPRLRILATEPGRATISGADPLPGWQPEGNGLFRATLPQPMEPSVVPADWPTFLKIGREALSRNLLFMGEQRLRQVYDRAELVPGTFLVGQDRRSVIMNPPPGMDPRRDPTEVARRNVLLDIHGAGGVEITGLVVERSAAPMMESALSVSASENVALRGTLIRNNNGSGLAVSHSSRVTLEDNTVTENGSTGIGAWAITGLTMRRNTTTANNWRGAAGGFVDWAVAGTKLLQIHGAVIEDLRASHNAAQGLWLDTDIVDVHVAGADLSGNHGPGLTVEAAQGPVSITASRILGNSQGIVAAAARQVSVENTIVACNSKTQILISGEPNRGVADHRSGTVTVVNNTGWRLTNSLVIADDKSGALVATTLPTGPWGAFLDSLHSENNVWAYARDRGAFRGVWGVSWEFDAWRRRIQDVGSRFEKGPDPRCPQAQ